MPDSGTDLRVLVRRLDAQAVLPRRMTAYAAGADVHACLEAPLVLPPGGRVAVPTGLAIALPPTHEAQVRPRSGLAFKHGVTVLNAPGTIDADYRGEVKVLLINHGDAPFEIAHGDRIAQLVVAPVCAVAWSTTEALPDPEPVVGEAVRGDGGFGSTGGA